MNSPPGWPWSVVLASRSPRRLELLRSLGVEPEVRPADIDESVLAGEDPVTYVRRLAVAKAGRAARGDEVVIGADTTVSVGPEIVGKPADAADAFRMLRLLAGRWHQVHTAVAVRTGSGTRTAVVTSDVEFIAADDELLKWYVARGESLDKAGGYAIQGGGALLVATVRGSTTNVVGLPLAELHQLMTTR
jgi:septum formation protein